VNNAVAVKGEGKPYDGLRAILSAVWTAVDAPTEPASRRRPPAAPVVRAEARSERRIPSRSTPRCTAWASTSRCCWLVSHVRG
jgi:hypothetical protein